jgi:hypothetical protein
MTREELRAEIDALSEAAKIAWDDATREAKTREDKIRTIKDALEAA